MFYATCTLRHTGPDGGLQVFGPGESLPDFQTWDYAVQVNLVRQGSVRVVPQRLDDPEVVKLPQSVSAAVPAAVADAPQFTCVLCPKANIASERGLKIHMKRVHGEQA